MWCSWLIFFSIYTCFFNFAVNKRATLDITSLPLTNIVPFPRYNFSPCEQSLQCSCCVNSNTEANSALFRELYRKQGKILNTGVRRCLEKGNIAKGTTDPRVKFISQDYSSQFTNLEYWSRFNFVTSTKLKQQNTNQTSALKFRLNFNFKILTKVLKDWTKVKLYDQTSASKSVTNWSQHDPQHQHQQY